MSIQDFKNALSAAGYPTDDEVVADDRLHRAHRVGDKAGKRDIRYQLACDGSFYYGWFIYQGGERVAWHSKGQQITASEAAAQKLKIDAQRKASKQAQMDGQRTAAKRAEYIWSHAQPAPATEPYLAQKGVAPGPCRVSRGVLIVPVYRADGVLCSLQFITQTTKRYLKEGKKGTLTLQGSPTVALCEGYATGATIHAATGWTVVVCFDTAGLKAAAGIRVGEAIVICADDDQWVFRSGMKPVELMEPPPGDDSVWLEWRKSNMLFNPGIEAATAALKKVGGSARLVNPKFKNTASRPTDFNDLQVLEGLDAVKAQLLSIPEVPPDIEFAPPDDMGGMVPCYDPEDPVEPIETAPFKIMGHNQGVYFFLPRGSKQLVALTPSSLSKNNLFSLAPMEWWKERFAGPKGISWDHACNALMRTSEKMGVFKPELMLRGSGVWLDAGRIVVHCGDKLVVDGVTVDPFQLPGRFVYESSSKIFDLVDNPLDSIDAIKLRKICELCSWENPLSGALLAGWIVMAPVCAMLDWRPHIWLTGESQAGKSFVMNKIIMPILRRIAIKMASGTSEPGIRQILGCDGRPIIMDEMETESARDDITVQSVLMLARKASSGDVIAKGTQDGVGKVFAVNSMFCFSSINPAVKQRADESRISLLSLKRNRDHDADQQFQDLKAFARETLTEDYARRMLARTIKNIHAIIKNSETFADAAADVLRDRRAADQIAPMLAGVYSLHGAGVISLEAAKKFITDHDWTLHTAVSESADHDRLYDRLMTSTINVTASHARIEAQLGMVIGVALGYEDANYTQGEAIQALKNIDVKIGKDSVYLRKPSQHITKLLRDTPWVNNWSKSLCKIPGLLLTGKTPVAFGSTTAHAVIIPCEKFKRGDMLL